MNRSFSRATLAFLLGLVLLALFFRIYRISAAGLAEDEAGKWKAIQEYSQGRFLADSDHPMLVKMLALASNGLGHAWNRTVGRAPPFLVASDEALLRLPNVILGSLTTIVVFLMGRDFCNPRVGWLAAVLWATGVTAIACYAAGFGRPDISVRQLSDPHYVPPADGTLFFLVQEGRRYFETDSLFDFLARRWAPWEQITRGGTMAVKVYRYQRP